MILLWRLTCGPPYLYPANMTGFLVTSSPPDSRYLRARTWIKPVYSAEHRIQNKAFITPRRRCRNEFWWARSEVSWDIAARNTTWDSGTCRAVVPWDWRSRSSMPRLKGSVKERPMQQFRFPTYRCQNSRWQMMVKSGTWGLGICNSYVWRTLYMRHLSILSIRARSNMLKPMCDGRCSMSGERRTRFLIAS